MLIFSKTADSRHEKGLGNAGSWLYSSYTAVNDFNASDYTDKRTRAKRLAPAPRLKVRRVSRGGFRTTNIGFHHAI